MCTCTGTHTAIDCMRDARVESTADSHPQLRTGTELAMTSDLALYLDTVLYMYSVLILPHFCKVLGLIPTFWFFWLFYFAIASTFCAIYLAPYIPFHFHSREFERRGLFHSYFMLPHRESRRGESKDFPESLASPKISGILNMHTTTSKNRFISI